MSVHHENLNARRARIHNKTVQAKNALRSLENKKRNLLAQQKKAGPIHTFFLGRQIRKINTMLPGAQTLVRRLNRAGMNIHRAAIQRRATAVPSLV
jgi:hypothetical protein